MTEPVWPSLLPRQAAALIWAGWAEPAQTTKTTLLINVCRACHALNKNTQQQYILFNY